VNEDMIEQASSPRLQLELKRKRFSLLTELEPTNQMGKLTIEY